MGWVPSPPCAWFGAGGLVLLFGVLVLVHARAFGRRERSLATRRFHQRGLARLDGQWTTFPANGERFRAADHPYADDLDLFGRASLFQFVDTTETLFGEERLAQWLMAAADLDTVRERQAAVKDIAGRFGFRERLSTFGALVSADKPDVTPFLEWAEGKLGGGLSCCATTRPGYG
jgi:hypothetical protein